MGIYSELASSLRSHWEVRPMEASQMIDFLDQVEQEGSGYGAYSTEKIASRLIAISLMPKLTGQEMQTMQQGTPMFPNIMRDGAGKPIFRGSPMFAGPAADALREELRLIAGIQPGGGIG